jgi:class 3 adenylate cyclase/tetratricopeptide (TPR) repeat protein
VLPNSALSFGTSKRNSAGILFPGSQAGTNLRGAYGCTMSANQICTACGAVNEAAAQFCASCGAAFPGQAPLSQQRRKVVTVLFSDVVGSTELAQELDPEVLGLVMSRYFEEMQSVLERHGGMVEKFIGDAVMAVFGVPRAHEDDALRGVRAAVEMGKTLDRLNEELKRTFGITVAIRTGVNTGEVVAGDPSRGQSFVAGEAVNMAARLEQNSQAGEILVGEVTYRLVQQAVVVEEVGPLTVKGIEKPVPAWKVLKLVPGAPGWTRRLDSPLVGRERELGELKAVFNRTTAAGGCEFVTLMGPAGVGKSRLTAEFLSTTGGGATVLTGRCQPYGEGITFWPVAEVLRDAAGIGDEESPEEARWKLSELLPSGPEASLIRDRLDALLGLGSATPGIQETFWAVRKLIEHLAGQRPLTVVFDDIHWAEPTLLDLLEYLADWIRDSPVLILCQARRELLDIRPGWMTARPNATLITLQPLSESDTETLINNLVGGPELAGEAPARIAELAEGNPLYVEQTLRMLVDEGVLQSREGDWIVGGDLSNISIPPTIQALLTARLDRLEEEERSIIARASVVGRVFWWGAICELSPAETEQAVTSRLQSLMRKELIQPDHAELTTEDAFRFVHVLVWDAAYRMLPKSARAELHERLTGWLETKMRERAGEYEEILGYHLEQAYRSLLDLGPINESVVALGRRAAAPLVSAGQRAYVRGDMPAAVNLFSRAASLLQGHDVQRVELLPQLAFALMETGDFVRFQKVVAETREAATTAGDPGLEAHATILELWDRLFTDPEGWVEVAGREAARATAAFEDLGDERGLARGWSLLGLVHVFKAEFGPSEQAWEKAADHAHRAGDRRDELESLSWVPLTVWAGPTPAERGLRRCQELLERAQGDKKATSSALSSQALFEAGLGRFEEARELLARARGLLEELALTVWMAGPLAQLTGWAELLAGDPAAAEEELRWGQEQLSKIGEVSWLSTVVGILAEAVYAQGRYEEAERFTQISEESGGTEDVYSHALWRSVRAKVLANQRRIGEAERLARESVALAEPTDFLHLRWHALMSHAEVLRLVGRKQEGKPLLSQAIQLAEQKGNLVAAQLAASALAELDGTRRLSSAAARTRLPKGA